MQRFCNHIHVIPCYSLFTNQVNFFSDTVTANQITVKSFEFVGANFMDCGLFFFLAYLWGCFCGYISFQFQKENSLF